MWARAEKEAEAAELEAEMAEVCGVINAATARLVRLISQVLATESWHGSGVRSASHWVAWKCGVSPARARTLVLTARRLVELPATGAAFDNGELCEDQMAVVCRHAPASVDAEAATLARSATVVQLRRVLGSYPFAEEAKADPTEAKEPEAPSEHRTVSFGTTESGTWRLSAELPADEGASVERALVTARDELFRAGEHDRTANPRPAHVDWADAFLAMAERSLGGAIRPCHERNLVLLHVDMATNGHLHLGPAVGDGIRRFLGCDARIRPVLEAAGRPVSVGRAFRILPERTRIVIEKRDRGCRVPGCDRRRWLHIHHIQHWEDGGTSDTENLIALCQRHHRLHHLGKLGIQGNADIPAGVHSPTSAAAHSMEPADPSRPAGGSTSPPATSAYRPAPGLTPPASDSTSTGSTSTNAPVDQLVAMRLPMREISACSSWAGKGWLKEKKVALTVVRSLVM